MTTEWIEFPKIMDPRGNLTFLQNEDQIPFIIKRAFWTYDVPGGISRGGHAYRNQAEVIIALSGSFDVVTTDSGGLTKTFSLNRSYYGLLVPALTWRQMVNFSTNALSLHLSSSKYDQGDYIHDFAEFQKLCK